MYLTELIKKWSDLKDKLREKKTLQEREKFPRITTGKNKQKIRTKNRTIRFK